ncbi:NAD(P)-binding protein [Schizophyllum commune H4-8]|uniref:NAD(P)-binding protein n=1 Tax=Schizophyllum commune (strain H4-8 / FGSC 9210) TaxID=578458 RepID=D8PY83_SCHCM|nr:NAD(P)-binding protein [Schizophyllum commune H4-8]KAI5897222.1 NAD(P)-binding protein [Schizophyllum commune H4-8]
MGQIYSQMFPPKAKFSVNHIPDLSGKVMLVTGANSGIGKETAKALLQHNAKVYIGARSPSRAEEAIEELKSATGKQALFLKIDLGNLKSVKAAAQELQSKETQLHALFNNAGVAMCPVEMVTVDGYDCQFGTNVLGHFYLTKLLLPTLLSTAKTTSDGTVRVVNTASSGHTIVDKIDFNTLKDGPARRKMSTTNLYGQSKLGNVLFSNELARRYGDQGIISTSLNPGNLSSNLYRHMSPIVLKIMNWTVLYPNAMGALTQLYAGTMDGKELNGKYLIPWARIGHPSRAGSDAALAKALWEWCEEQVEGL